MPDDTTENMIKCSKCLNFIGTASNFRHVIVFNKSQKTILPRLLVCVMGSKSHGNNSLL